MVGLRKSTVPSEQLRRACTTELSRLKLSVGNMTAETDHAGRWAIMLTTGGRTFHFGTLGSPRFFFREIAADREEDLTTALPPPSQDPAVVWQYAFWLLDELLGAASAQRLNRPVI